MTDAFSSDDIASAIKGFGTSSRAQLLSGLDANPDDAARVVSLSDDTGVPPQVIAPDLEGFEQSHKAALATHLMMNDPKLLEYVNSHPMAASVSNDDWGNLAELSKHATAADQILSILNAPWDIARAGVAAGGRAAWEQLHQLGDIPQTTEEEVGREFPALAGPGILPETSRAITTLGINVGAAGLYAGSDIFSALTAGIGKGAEASAVAAGMEPMQAQRLGRDLSTAAEAELYRRGAEEVPKLEGETPAQRAERQATVQQFRDVVNPPWRMWIEAGQEPPRGMDPEIDARKAAINAEALGKIEEYLQAAQASTTKERSAELFSGFVRQFGDYHLSIGGDAAAALYGDRPPAMDDGLLGWVPGIADKLEQARNTGADVEVPLADMISKMDPKIFKGLHDDIRVWPGGVTAREATVPTEPKQMIPEPLPQVRGAAGLEPMFAMGDRKLQLALQEKALGLSDFGEEAEFHTYQLLDEQGQVVGGLELWPNEKTKQLYVGMINGKAGLWANSFGPGLMRDILRQIKALYPDYTELGGYRISGARDVAGKLGPATVKLDVPSGWDSVQGYEDTRGIFENAYRHEGVEAEIPQALTQEQRLLNTALQEELDKITGGKVSYAPATGIRFGAQEAHGVYLGRGDQVPKILVDLLGPDPLGTTRHESMHFIEERLLTPAERRVLHQTAQDEGWVDRYNIAEKYAGQSGEVHRMEGIAEAFREWMANEDLRRSDTPTGRIFKKIHDFLQALKARVARVLGYEPSWEELFQKIRQGEIGEREPSAAVGAVPLLAANEDRFAGRAGLENDIRITKDAIKWREDLLSGRAKPEDYESNTARYHAALTKQRATAEIKQLQEQLKQQQATLENWKEPEIPYWKPPLLSVDDRNTLQAKALGLDKKSLERLQTRLDEQFRSDLEKFKARAEKEQTKRQTAEWKSNRAEMEKEVEATIRQRPDVAVDLFIGSGELFGNKLRQRYTLRADDLTTEQKAALPDHYVSKNGLPVDEVAKLFGFGSGDAMVESLAAYHAIKGDLSPQKALEKLIDKETDRQMEAKYGNLPQEILEEAYNQALGEASFNRVYEEYAGHAMSHGLQSIGKEEIRALAKENVGKMVVGQINSQKYFPILNRHATEADRANLAGDFATASIAMQKRTLALAEAAEVIKVEKEQAKLQKTTRYYAKSWDPTKDRRVDPEFSIFTRDILQRVGLRNGMTGPGLAERIARSRFTDLADFTTKTEDENKVMGLSLQVPDFLLKGPQKPLKEMTVDEWRQVAGAITNMDKVGRMFQRVQVRTDVWHIDDWVDKAVDQLKSRFPVIPAGPGVPKKGVVRKSTSSLLAAMTEVITVFSRWDGRDPHGLFTETFSKDGIAAEAAEARLVRETAKALGELGKIKDGDKLIDSPLINPRTKKPVQLTRKNLVSIISNMGNKYNWKVLTEGYKIDPDVLRGWVESVSTPEDVDYAHNLSKILDGLWEKSQSMYEHEYGTPPESVVPQPFTMHGKQYPGWYHPILADEDLSKFLNKMPSTEKDWGFWPSTSNPYIKRRTGAIQALDLTYDALPGRLAQMIHDIELRPFVNKAARLIKNDRFRDAIRAHYGREYLEELDQWIMRVAGDSSIRSEGAKRAEMMSNALRQNVIQAHVAFGLGTVEKHAATAWAMSARELGQNPLIAVPKFAWETAGVVGEHFIAGPFKRAVMDLFGKSQALGDDQWDFAHGMSEVLQARVRNYLNTMVGQYKELEGKNWFNRFRYKWSEWGAKAVAFSDLLSATPLWVAKYREAIEDNGGDIGAAVRDADFAVVRAHGSTFNVVLPRIAANRGAITPWFTSLYGFMGTAFQRQVEIYHDLNDTYSLGKRGEINEAAKKFGSALSSIAVYYLWVGAVEEAVTSQFFEDRRGLGQKVFWAALGDLTMAMAYARDLVYDIKEGRESASLISTPINEAIHLKRDFAKKQPFAKWHAGQLIQDFITLSGDLAGIGSAPVGRAAHYGYDLFEQFTHPHGAGDVYRGVITGHQKLRVVK